MSDEQANMGFDMGSAAAFNNPQAGEPVNASDFPNPQADVSEVHSGVLPVAAILQGEPVTAPEEQAVDKADDVPEGFWRSADGYLFRK